MWFAPKHVVINYVKTKKYCHRKNFEKKVKCTFSGYQRCKL